MFNHVGSRRGSAPPPYSFGASPSLPSPARVLYHRSPGYENGTPPNTPYRRQHAFGSTPLSYSEGARRRRGVIPPYGVSGLNDLERPSRVFSDHRPSVGSTLYDRPPEDPSYSPPLYKSDPSRIDGFKDEDEINFNILHERDRKLFLNRLGHALMAYGAPSDRVQSQLLRAARVLQVDCEVVHIPGILLLTLGDLDVAEAKTDFIKSGSSLDLGKLAAVDAIYDDVIADRIDVLQGVARLDRLLESRPIYGKFARLFFSFTLSLMICVLAFGGSFLDMWVAGFGAIFISIIRIFLSNRARLYGWIFDITMAGFMSFIARALDSIPGHLFCYSAVSSAAIVGILPGYLILRSSLELGSKNAVCGAINLVCALFMTVSLGFALPMGSDFYLIFDRPARATLRNHRISSVIDLVGIFVADNNNTFGTNIPAEGQFSFIKAANFERDHVVQGCLRPPENPWYLRPFPYWIQFFVVPLFSIVSSMSNMQPLRSINMLSMVVISCISYAANKLATRYIFEDSEVVSVVGAFVTGILGNLYALKFGGSAFTMMVTGVLFLVPSGLSAASSNEGMTAGSSIALGSSIVIVGIGITVGLFASEVIIQMFTPNDRDRGSKYLLVI
ncbi:hypothetical protein BJ322DRAFT_743777 [Thelephora terrestris]|uniref:Threonine/serine exporter-like N-terminal domain-containing protein n=1 Tax=Thelephora terrestris TaxID=56493 RepID=A0A9P6HHZ1_9AGAM|nr:hypothetical protein BJ322DRAFT_743777 [Thelephora terrestris]